MDSKKHKKIKKTMEAENISEVAAVQDFVAVEDHRRSKKEKKIKLGKKNKKDVELISTVEETKVKGKRNKLKKKEGSDVGYTEAFQSGDAPNDQCQLVGKDGSVRADRSKKEQKKEKRRKDRKTVSSTSVDICKGEELQVNKEIIESKLSVEGDISKMKRKKKKMKTEEVQGMDHCGDTVLFQSAVEEQGVKRSKKEEKREKKRKSREAATGNLEFLKERDCIGGGNEERVELAKVRRKKKRDREKVDDSIHVGKAILDDKNVGYDEVHSGSSRKKRDREKGVLDVESEMSNKNNKKRKLAIDAKERDKGDLNTEDREGSLDHPRNSKPKSSKSVKFSGHDEIFPLNDAYDVEKEPEAEKLVRGKRFTREEDALILEAIQKYIETHELGEGGKDMVMDTKKHPEVKNCWKEISAALPWRPLESTRDRGCTLLTRSEKRSWTDEEIELVRKYYDQHGPVWKPLADALGKNRRHVKDLWRRNRLVNRKKGPWSQEEYQALFDLVNIDLQMKVFEEKNTKFGMRRENISWGAISDKLQTRHDMECCLTWYNKLASPMVKKGEWADIDDYRMLNELYDLDACCAEDVDWDDLLPHRSGDLCQRRWTQMAKFIGDSKRRSFSEQVQVLAERYCPKLIEVREALDSRPVFQSKSASKKEV